MSGRREPGAGSLGGWQGVLQRGCVIPAHPLALTATRKLDERRQRALTRYYLAAGAGGVAVGVHTTQFAIRHPKFALYRPVLELAAETVSEWERRSGRAIVRVAGVIGATGQAVREARLARELGYHLGLLSLGALARAPDARLIAHARAVAAEIPLMGFYLQPAVGGRKLSYAFWRKFVEIDGVVAIKIAPFNRYDTWDVVRAVADSGRRDQIALYTGNDDSIVVDLLTEYRVAEQPGLAVRLRMVGGLLGHWAFWTRRAVTLLEAVRSDRWIRRGGGMAIALSLGAQITDANSAIFDAANGFAGCIPGIHEILRRQGLLRGRWCLDRHEELSPGQMRGIERVLRAYPHLADDEFVREGIDAWMR